MGQFAEAAAARLLVPAARSPLLWAGARSHTPTVANLFGVGIRDTTVAEASRDLIETARAGRRTRVVFANAHVVNELATRTGYSRIVSTADRVFADGSGMALAARLAGLTLQDNVNGTDLFPRLAADAAAAGVSIFLLGGADGTAEAARKRMESFGLGKSLVGSHHGFFKPGSTEEDAAIMAANASGAGIVLVGMGVPLQDEWISRIGERLRAPVRVGVGGLFDYFAGNVTRAPHVFRVIGCEWVWRLAQEPRRMAKRYLVGNAVFMMRAAAEAVRLRSRAAPLRPVLATGNLKSH
jgi:exopolysaccharide biosynthesis WecB/TagA/CpsF family protein